VGAPDPAKAKLHLQEKSMTTQPDNQRMKSNSRMLLLATWLWILAGTFSGGAIGLSVANDSGIVFVSIGFTLGGIFGGFITRFLPIVIGWQKKGWALSLIFPILVLAIILFSQFELDEFPVLLIWMTSGILGSSYFVWIPKWIKLLRQSSRSAWRAVVLPLVLIILNTCFISVIILGTAAQ